MDRPVLTRKNLKTSIMRKETINIFKYEELSDKAKKVARQWYTSGEYTFDYIYEEAWSSAKEFAETFGVNLRSIDFTNRDARFSIDTDIEVTGIRLATYIWNNYKDDIYTGQWKKSWTTDQPVKHRKVKSQLCSKQNGWSNPDILGKYYNKYYSTTKLVCECPFTGICYDADLLQPILDFMNKPNKHTEFKELIDECFYSLINSVNSEIEYQYSDEAVEETIIANEYEFTEDGERY